MTRRVTAAAMAALMGASVLAGCGGTGTAQTSAASKTSAAAASSTATTAAPAGSTSGDVSMVFAWWGNQTRNERTTKAIEQYQKDNPGVKFAGQFS